MTGLKTNERPGTRAEVRYLRMSASKVRVVLDLVRGKPVAEATHILAFSERLAAQVIDKCLRSAVANAGHNDDIPAEELYISACYADEGPSLKRFRPRARGRAGRIRKQTCHLTIVVSRFTDDQLDAMRAQAEARALSRGARGASATPDSRADRRRRVAGSRGATASPAAATPVEDTPVTDTPVEDTPVTATPVDTVETVEENTVTDTVETVDHAAPAVSDTVADTTAGPAEAAGDEAPGAEPDPTEETN
jgi:large subunit ribosomal protein L22